MLRDLVLSSKSPIVHVPILIDHLMEYTKMTQYVNKIRSNCCFFSTILSQATEDFLQAIDLQHFVFVDLVEEVIPKDVTAESIGHLQNITGVVVRANMHVPQIVRSVYRCGQCGTVQDPEFTILVPEHVKQCMQCKSNDLHLMKDSCIIDEQQKVRIQTDSQHMNCILLGPHVRKVTAGDPVTFVGFPVALIQTFNRQRVKKVDKEIKDGYAISQQGQSIQMDQEKKGGYDLQESRTEIIDERNHEIQFKIVFFVTKVVQQEHGNTVYQLFDSLTSMTTFQDSTMNYYQRAIQKYNISEDFLNQIQKFEKDPLLINKLISSFAPFIHSNEEIKLALLLQLVGGDEKIAFDGSHQRSDINILLVGDPSCAKSMFLKYVAGLSDKNIFTSGKSASAAGLTAAVAIDPDTGEWGIEPGAMLRANGGICCIDEFDKINQQDQSALHECMEQQQVSISKAGVSATMEAKTPVLAAMNPYFGKYNQMLSLKQNISIGSAILSRFDLVFVLIDQPNADIDRLIAKRIIGIQRKQSEQTTTPFSLEFLKNYIKLCSLIQPKMNELAQKKILDLWMELRSEDLKIQRKNQRVTIRQLESLSRLSEAFAKLSLSDEVSQAHVLEAYKLYKSTVIQMVKEEQVFEVEEFINEKTEASKVEKSMNQSSITDKKSFSISITEIDRVCIVVKFLMTQQGIQQIGYDVLLGLIMQNLQFAEITATELGQIAASLIKSLVFDHYYLQKVNGDPLEFMDQDFFEFTHLSPMI
ncbi:DNA replication licensing factor MCM6 [Spironucleus salmonicida]|nr:DNA replication licensing factor MCM6 [Spironucleus salmonicida]